MIGTAMAMCANIYIAGIEIMIPSKMIAMSKELYFCMPCLLERLAG